MLEFERPVIELERKIDELRALASAQRIDMSPQIRQLESKARKLQQEIFADLTPLQKVQLSRHPGRPYMLDYVGYLCEDFVELLLLTAPTLMLGLGLAAEMAIGGGARIDRTRQLQVLADAVVASIHGDAEILPHPGVGLLGEPYFDVDFSTVQPTFPGAELMEASDGRFYGTSTGVSTSSCISALNV